MAELGDLLTGGSQRAKDVTVDMLDYEYLDKCRDTGLIKAIVRKLKSGEEGHYPHLAKHAETRLLQELPQAERSKMLRMEAEPQPDEIFQAAEDLHAWEDEITGMSSKMKDSCENNQRAPKWTSCAKAEAISLEVANLASSPGNGSANYAVSQPGRSAAQQAQTRKLSAYDFREWEKYNADAEVKRLEEEEQKEQWLKTEGVTSAKARVEQDKSRRAEKREHQLREATRGRFKESLSPFEKQRTAEMERVKGNEAFKAKEYEEAFRCYTCSLALDDANAKVYSNRAASAHKLERLDQAEDDCTRAISLDPGFKRAWMRRGMVRHSRGKYSSSVADFTEALHLDPSDRHAQKFREHSAAKEREVEGPAVGQTEGRSPTKRGRVLIEEVDSLQDDTEEFITIVPTTTTAPPPIPEIKRAMVAHGWLGC